MGNFELAMHSLSRWAEKLGMAIDTQMLMGCCYIESGRNTLANTFIKSDCTHLVFVDSDIGFITNNFFELLLTQKDIVAGLYTRKKVNWKAVHAAALAGVPPEMLEHCSGDFPIHCLPGKGVEMNHEAQKVLTMPSGFMCISRKAFETFMKAKPERQTTPGNPGHIGWEFFRARVVESVDSTGTKTSGFDSEDNIFCKEMLTLGIDTYVCPWMNLTHYGEHLFQACWPCSIGAYVHLPGWMEKNQGSAA